MKVFLLILGLLASASATFRCGLKHGVAPRIVNGVEAIPHDWPWAVLLALNGQRCGGSLITHSFVLTAAHCSADATPAQIKAYLGCHQAKRNCQVVSGIKRNIVHEHYRFPHNDIALLELNRRVSFTNRIYPICLNSRTPKTGRAIVAIGWGKLAGDKPIASKLMQANMRVVSDSECQRFYGSLPSTGLLCCDAGTGSSTTCGGDSGSFVGARSLRDARRWVQLGVVSFGAPGCPSTQKQGSVDVADFRPWISKYVRDAHWFY